MHGYTGRFLRVDLFPGRSGFVPVLPGNIKDRAATIDVNPTYQDNKSHGATEGSLTRSAPAVLLAESSHRGQMANCERLVHIESDKVRAGAPGSYACSARCGKAHTIPAGHPCEGATRVGPEYESYWSFSGSHRPRQHGSGRSPGGTLTRERLGQPGFGRAACDIWGGR